VAVDGTGNLYVADSDNNKIKDLSQGSSSWTDITGNGGFYWPRGIAVDSAGNLYVADTGNNKIKELVAQTLPIVPTTLNSTVINNINNALNNLNNTSGSSNSNQNNSQGITVSVNGTLVQFDVAPMIVDSRTLV
jgi:sugar lactone lactonase YvrE